MVTTDVAQLSSECNAWRDTLRSLRDEFTHLKHTLQQVAARQTQRDFLQQVEHFHNQFHIQLINIHDLKQAIKNHDRKIGFEKANGQVAEETLAEHENLYEEYQSLDNTLRNLRDDFEQFVVQTK